MRRLRVILRRKDAEGSPTHGRWGSLPFASLWVGMTLVVLVFPTIASACPVCFGDPNSAMQKAANNGIWVLLGVIAFVQLGFVALFVSFWRRARELRRRREQLRLIEGGA